MRMIQYPGHVVVIADGRVLDVAQNGTPAAKRAQRECVRMARPADADLDRKLLALGAQYVEASR